MVRQGRVQLRDVRVHVQAQWWNAGTTAFGDRDSHKGRVASLALEQSYFTNLEQLQVWHRIDESSPLWRMRDNLKHVLDGIEVSVGLRHGEPPTSDDAYTLREVASDSGCRL